MDDFVNIWTTVSDLIVDAYSAVMTYTILQVAIILGIVAMLLKDFKDDKKGDKK